MAETERNKTSRPGEEAIASVQDAAAIGQPFADETKCLRRAGTLLAVSDLLWILQAALIAFALGALLSATTGSSRLPSTSASFWWIPFSSGLGVMAVALLRVLLQNRASNIARKTAREIQSRAREALLNAAIASSPAASFPASGAFAAHVTDQIDLLGPYYRNFAPQSVRLKIVPIAIVLATAVFSWLAALILLICGPLIPVFMALVGTRAKAASAAQQEELTRLGGTLLDRIRGLETLTLFGALQRTKDDIASAGERFRVGTMRVLKIAFLSSTVLELFSALGIAFCAVYVGFSLLGDIRVGTWSGALSFPVGLFVLLLAPEFFAPLRAFAAAYHDRSAGLAAQEKLESLLNEIRAGEKVAGDWQKRPAETTTQANASEVATPPSIEFSGVSLCLAGQPVFKDLDLNIQPGDTVLLMGESGSGKTTLLDCVLGFHVPDQGEVRIAGYPVQEVVSQLRRNVMWLGQAPRLFHGSLKANLLMGAEEASGVQDEEIWAALKLAGADGLVRRLPQGLDTPLGEDGFGLSVGEIRRVALARAAMRKNAGILLADEPTAGLDEETAQDVINGLRQLSSERTTLIVTHDPAVLKTSGRQLDMCALNAISAQEVAE
ncbi:thiol reductant ABC exporter subunit CydD [Roseibium sp. SCPC15]|uniref:thiol reductant ABC exporter subunit CydD n=1 Tax=Roseibium sp. SCP15 TaxID=3141376 RepID=UPI00333883CD